MHVIFHYSILMLLHTNSNKNFFTKIWNLREESYTFKVEECIGQKGLSKSSRRESKESNQGDISDQLKKGAQKFHRNASN